MEADTSLEVEVEVPAGCFPGTEILVTHGEQSVTVVIPEGMQPGEMMMLSLPPSSHLLDAPPAVEVNVPDGCWVGDTFNVDYNGRSWSVVVPDGCGPGSLLLVDVPNDEETSSPQSTECPPSPSPPPAAKTDDSHVLPPELSDTSDEEMEQVATAKFAIGAPVEVLRTDGGWTLATVTHFDDGGFTYTVRLTDGREKYFVEEEDLRIPRFLLLSTANL